MKAFRFFTFVMAACFALTIAAQNPLTVDGSNAQKALVDYLRLNGMAPTIDTRDNSVCFKSNGIFYWVTFDESTPVLYTIHRKGLKFDEDAKFKASCARVACNEVNRKHSIKCTYNNRRVDFVLQTYAKNPSDFHDSFRKNLAAFRDVEDTYKKVYETAYKQWEKDSIEQAGRFKTPDVLPGNSPLTVSYIGFANFDAAGNMISDYDQPLRKSAIRFIKASLDVVSTEKGLFKLGMKVYYVPSDKPSGILVRNNNSSDYSATQNLEVKKTKKAIECVIGPVGSDADGFWEAGEYRVEIYDYETGSVIHSTTFNVL